jgi:hypothetical protein
MSTLPRQIIGNTSKIGGSDRCLWISYQLSWVAPATAPPEANNPRTPLVWFVSPAHRTTVRGVRCVQTCLIQRKVRAAACERITVKLCFCKNSAGILVICASCPTINER